MLGAPQKVTNPRGKMEIVLVFLGEKMVHWASVKEQGTKQPFHFHDCPFSSFNVSQPLLDLSFSFTFSIPFFSHNN